MKEEERIPTRDSAYAAKALVKARHDGSVAFYFSFEGEIGSITYFPIIV